MFILVTLGVIVVLMTILALISLGFINIYRFINQGSLMILLNIFSYEYIPYLVVWTTIAMYLYLNIYKSLQKNITYITFI